MNIQNRKNRIIHSDKGVKLADHGRILTLLGLIVVIAGAAALAGFLLRSTGNWSGTGLPEKDETTIAEGISGAALVRYRMNDTGDGTDTVADSSGTDTQTPGSGSDAQTPDSGTDAQTPDSGRAVLFISSYDPTYNTYSDQLQGMQGVFAYHNVALNTLSMDSYEKRTDFDVYEFLKKVRVCMARQDYSAVMLGDDAALRFALDNREELFSDIPVMFFGINDKSLAEEAEKYPNFTGYLESDNIAATLDLGLQMLPDTDRIVAIYDNSNAGLSYYRLYQEISKDDKYRHITLDAINFGDYTQDEFKKKISQYQDGTILLQLNASTDADGNFYSVDSSTKMICGAASVPVLRNSIGGYYNGVLAGKTVRFDLTTREAAKNIMKVLDGDLQMQDIPLSDDVDGTLVANYDALKKFNVPLSRLPQNTLVLNEPVTFNSQFGSVFYPLLIVISGLLMILAGSRVEVSQRKKAEASQRETATKLLFASEHDVLTGVLNRQTAIHRMHQDSRLVDEPYALILVDGDNFKDINETYGHQEGDRLLKKFARELQAVVDRNNGQVARFGGDEFLILLYGRHVEASDPVMREILDIFRQRHSMGIDSISVYVSCGIANSEPGISAADLLVGAELALLQSKKRGKNTYTFFSREMQDEEHKRDQLRKAILDAIEKEEMYMLFQPQVKTSDGTLEGFEALVRIKDSRIGPGVFIPIAEENGWIRRIGRITTELTIRQISEWIRQGLEVPPVSVNYSAEQLDDVEYVYFLKNMLETYHVPPEKLKIEITESLFIDNNKAAEELFTQLKSMGVTLLMDDFGTGYSSLNYLNYIPVDVVKIDKTIVDTHLTDENDYFVRDVITLAHDLHKQTICEGVEMREQYERLKRYHCDGIQGYYFGRPLKAEDAVECMKRETLLPD